MIRALQHGPKSVRMKGFHYAPKGWCRVTCGDYTGIITGIVGVMEHGALFNRKNTENE